MRPKGNSLFIYMITNGIKLLSCILIYILVFYIYLGICTELTLSDT